MRKQIAFVAALAITASLAPSATAFDYNRPSWGDSRVEEVEPNRNFAEYNLKASDSEVNPGCTSYACSYSYLKFPLYLGPNEKVASASLRLTPAVTSYAGVRTRGVADNSWTESGITWANKPALGGTGGVSGRVGCVAVGCLSVDVTPITPWNGGWMTIALTSDIYFEALSEEDGAFGADAVPRLFYTTVPYSDTQAPTAPTGLTQTGATATSAKIAWTPSTDNIYVMKYLPYLNGQLRSADVNGVHFWAEEIPVGAGQPDEHLFRQYTYQGLACGTSYTATVRARDPTGNLSTSAPLTITTAPCGTLLNETFTGSNGTKWVSEQDFFPNPDGQYGATKNPDWFAENGEVVIDSNTGRVNGGAFRMWTRKKDFLNVKVTHRLRVNGTRPSGYDGVKLWLRRKLCTPDNNPDFFEPGDCAIYDDSGTRASGSEGQKGYTAEYALGSKTIRIQKRVPTGTPGCTTGYDTLAQTGPSYEIPPDQWRTVGGSVRNNADGSVTISVYIGTSPTPVLSVTDRGAATPGACGVAPHTAAGRIGLRGDATNFNIDDFVVTTNF